MITFIQVLCAVLLIAPITLSERTQSTRLVTMTKAELMEIVDCISKSTNQALCDRFAVCNNKMPEQVKNAYQKCNSDINPNGTWRCNKKEKLFPSIEIPNKLSLLPYPSEGKSMLFDCIVGSTYKLNAEESKKMVDFETCIRDLYIGGCPVPKRT